MDIPHVVYPLICWWTFRSFPLFNASMNIYRFLCERIFICLSISLGIFLGVELLDSTVTLFNPLRKHHIISKVALAFYTSWWECVRVPISPHSCRYLYFPFVDLAILIDVKYYLIVVLVCIYITTTHVEHLFTCLLGICIFSSE